MKKLVSLFSSAFVVASLTAAAHAATTAAPAEEKKPVDTFFASVEAPAGTYTGYFTQIVGMRDGASLVLEDTTGKDIGFATLSKKDCAESYDIALQAFLSHKPVSVKISAKHEINAIKLEASALKSEKPAAPQKAAPHKK